MQPLLPLRGSPRSAVDGGDRTHKHCLRVLQTDGQTVRQTDRMGEKERGGMSTPCSSALLCTFILFRPSSRKCLSRGETWVCGVPSLYLGQGELAIEPIEGKERDHVFFNGRATSYVAPSPSSLSSPARRKRPLNDPGKSQVRSANTNPRKKRRVD